MSGLIPRGFIDALLARVDIVEVINSRVKLQRRGTNYMACCPFHDEKSPSFSVSQAKQFFHCFGCGAGGNVISFLMDYERLSFVEAVETLAAQIGVDVPKEALAASKQHDQKTVLSQVLADISAYYQQQLWQEPSASAYVKARGLSRETCVRFAVGFAPSGWDNVLRRFGCDAQQQQALSNAGMLITNDKGNVYDRFRERLMFPIRNARGQVLGFGGRVLDNRLPKYLNSPETPIFQKGRELYGLYEVLQTKRRLTQILVVEGYMDVLALAEQGVEYAVATLGTATTTEHLQRLFRYTDTIVCCFDGDNAGRQAAWRALEISLALLQDGRQLRFVFLPEREDPDTFIRQHGKAEFERYLQQAISLPDFLLQHLSAQNNLNHLDGLARLASQAAPLITQVPGKILQQLLFERMSGVVRMSPDKLRAVAQSTPIHAARAYPSTPREGETAPPPPMRLAVSLLLQFPQLAQQVDLEGVDETVQLPGLAIFCQLVTCLLQQPQLTTGSLLERWRGTPQHSYLQKLAVWEHQLPEAELVAEFEGAVRRLRYLCREKKIEMLLVKANLQGLEYAEKQLLQGLIAEQQP